MRSIEISPQARIDTLVRAAPGGEERRHTEYLGTVWVDGKLTPTNFRPMGAVGKGLHLPRIEVAFFLPDSLAYARERIADAQLNVSAVLQASGQLGAVIEAAASFVDDPSGTPTWIQLHVLGYGPWPFAISYRVVALTGVDAVR
ncbi:MAG: hypothetical protein WKF93_09680 [Acidimicrobiales bacterium]